MKETKSNWACVTEKLMGKKTHLSFSDQTSDWFRHHPQKVLNLMSYYKFATKMIGASKRVLDVGCQDGLGTYLLGKQCGFAKGIDIDATAIEIAKENYPDQCVEFFTKDIYQTSSSEKWDAIVHFQEKPSEKFESLCTKIFSQLQPLGITILGFPNSPSNVELLDQYCSQVLVFGANDEVIHTDPHNAPYIITIGCNK